MGDDLKESRFAHMTFGSNTILNYHLLQKLKLIGRSKFNHLTITLTLKNVLLFGFLCCWFCSLVMCCRCLRLALPLVFLRLFLGCKLCLLLSL
jgi:hypothetical protein